ncbi:MAG: TetR/AcrR family transcriptional regulator [Hyphomonas sp.]
MQPFTLFAPEAASLGKSARTRAQLMDAAVAVFARHGIEAASVNEIARAAGVANGTFYVHFRDKDEMASVVSLALAAEIARQLDEDMRDVDCAIQRVVSATRRFLQIASEQPPLGWAFLKACQALPDLRHQVGVYMRQDIARGGRQGVFTEPVDDFLIDCVGGLVLSALLSCLSGTAAADAGPRTAEMQLRLLGVEREAAKAASRQALDPLIG